MSIAVTSDSLRTKRINNNDLFAFFVSFFIGIVVHGYRFFNPIFSHDSMLIYQDEAEWQISLGRFLQPVYLMVRGKVCAPMLIGVASIIFFALSVCILIRIIGIDDRISIFFVCAILLINPSFYMSAATYIDWLDIYMLCNLLNVTGVYVFKKYKYGFFLGAIMIAASLALYQAYIQISIGIIIIIVISSILNKKDFKDIFLNTIKAGVMFLIAVVIYYIAYKIILKTTSVIPSASANGMENSFNQMRSFSFSSVMSTALIFIKQFFSPGTHKAPFYSIGFLETFINAVLFVLMLAESIYIFIKKKIKTANILLYFFVLGAMPFAFNISYFLSGCNGHVLTVYSFFYVYVLAISVLKISIKELTSEKYASIIKTATCIFLSCLVWKNAVCANQLYLKKDFDYQNTLSVVTKMTERIETIEGYIPGETPVAFIGNFANNDLYRNHRIPFNSIDGCGSNTNYSLSLTGDVNLKQYLEYVLAYPIDYTSDEETEALSVTDEVKNMPVYPSVGSIKMKNGTLIVKLS